MNAPVRTTIIYGLISATGVWAAAGQLTASFGWITAFKLMLWIIVSGYAMLMVRWSGQPMPAPFFPLVLLAGAAFWPGLYNAFFFMAMGTLAWIRSGICFHTTGLRSLIAEALTIGGGAGLVAALNPGGIVTWALSIWLFILIQSLYFFIVPVSFPKRRQPPPGDPFERACRNALRILEG